MSLSSVVLKILPPKSEEGRTSPYRTVVDRVADRVAEVPPPPVVYVPMAQSAGSNDAGQSEFAQLKQTLVVGTLLVALGLTVVVTLVWSLRAGLSFGLGGAVGALYLRLLAKSVEGNGGRGLPLGSARMAVFIGLMVVALKTEALAVLPAFFGFLTYKVFLLVYAIRLASKS
jgi:ATP synthase protein I